MVNELKCRDYITWDRWEISMS